jgi:hypothetical protein
MESAPRLQRTACTGLKATGQRRLSMDFLSGYSDQAKSPVRVRPGSQEAVDGRVEVLSLTIQPFGGVVLYLPTFLLTSKASISLAG